MVHRHRNQYYIVYKNANHNYIEHQHLKNDYMESGNTKLWGRLSTVDLLIKVARFVKKGNNIFIITMS